jgi:hypothetical protein
MIDYEWNLPDSDSPHGRIEKACGFERRIASI